MFSGCKSIQGTLSDKLFANNPELRVLNSFFSGCTSIVGAIPRDIFNNIPLGGRASNYLTDLDGFFSGTKVYGEIPVYVNNTNLGLLDRCKNLTSIAHLFSGCGSLTGPIPPKLLDGINGLLRVNHLFSGCSGLVGDIPQELFKSKSYIYEMSAVFNGCSGLVSSIPVDLLEDCTSVTNISYMFQGCTGLRNQIPERISTWKTVEDPEDPLNTIDVETVIQYGLFDRCSKLVTAVSVFSGCENLNSTIPATLLINGQNITSTASMFSGCLELYDDIPEDLFKNCPKLMSVESMFYNCRNLSNPMYDEVERPYVLPPTLFSKNYNLANASKFLYNYSWGNTGLKGKIPVELFANNILLTNISNFLYTCRNVIGEIESNTFINNTKLANASVAFASTGITGLGSGLFNTCTELKNMSSTFSGCSNISSAVPAYWAQSSGVKATSYDACFRGCTNALNYADIPTGWK